MDAAGVPHVELGMYPFPSITWAWDEIWAAVHARAPWTPAHLTRSGDVHARWADPNCVVTHVCGYPYAARHADELAVVGAFELAIDEADGAYYRSVLLSADEATVDELVHSGSRAVANSVDSLSGWLSLLAATVGVGHTWPGPVRFTSAHLDSVRALTAGDADVACLDAWSLALIGTESPDLVAGLHRVGHGPRVPTPAIAARRFILDHRIDELRDAFADALTDTATHAAREALLISGFARLTADDYAATLALSA